MPAVETRKLAGLRLHVRAIVRDGTTAFVGSQSLRKLELDGRREVGVIVNDARTAKKIQSVFETDWAAQRGRLGSEEHRPPPRRLFLLPPQDDSGIDDRAGA